MVQSSKANFDLHTTTHEKEIWSLCLSFLIWIVHYWCKNRFGMCYNIFLLITPINQRSIFMTKYKRHIPTKPILLAQNPSPWSRTKENVTKNSPFWSTHYESLNKIDQKAIAHYIVHFWMSQGKNSYTFDYCNASYLQLVGK
jgi:hypothetical protein